MTSSESSSEASRTEEGIECGEQPGINFFGGTILPVAEDSNQSEGESSDSSYDSAVSGGDATVARLMDYGTDVASHQGILPSPADIFSETTGLPEFLDPEATRPLAVNPSHGSERAMNSENGPNLAPKLNPRKQEQGHTFDVAALAPRLGPQQSEASKRGLPDGAIITAAAKRYKPSENEDEHAYSDQQVALMGGKVGTSKKPVNPMGINDFMDQVGTASLPRRNTGRRDKEKEKRAKGQSAIGNWKTEAEMVLRQQFD